MTVRSRVPLSRMGSSAVQRHWGICLNLLHALVLQAVSMRKHLELNRKDKDGKFRLILVESRIHRLARYYRVRRALCHATEARVHPATQSLVSCVQLSGEGSSACWLISILSQSSISGLVIDMP